MEGYYKEEIMAKIDKQINKGVAKYGMSLEDNVKFNTEERIENISEELVDGLQYLEHLKVLNTQNKNFRQEVISAVGVLILLSASITNEHVKQDVITELKIINNAIRSMK